MEADWSEFVQLPEPRGFTLEDLQNAWDPPEDLGEVIQYGDFLINFR